MGSKRKYPKDENRKKKFWILLLFVLLFVQMTSAKGDSTAQILVGVENEEIMQDSELPTPKVTIDCPESQQEIIVDENTGYKVKDLVEDLKKGNGYSVECETDGKTEGKFKVKVKLSKSLQSDLDTRLKDVVYLTTYDGVLNVKNNIGEWDGEKFKKFDGSYAQSEFIDSKGETYYFNKDGEKVTGWKELNGNKYHFTKKGIMEKNKWKKLDKGKGYLGENGALSIGWVEIGEDVYYFDEDAIMVTGKIDILSSKCEFGKDGKLISKKSKLDPDKPVMALTFDDGPGERTGELLAVLEQYGAHATFFMQGQNVSSYEKEIKKMYEIGCELGNHTYNHPQLSLEADGGRKQIGKTNMLLKEICGHSATVMRPPYGDVSEAVSEAVGMPMILWNVDTLDWKTLDTQNTINLVMTQADDGDIVLMHDIHSPSIDAAIELIPRLIDNGYQLVTISELADFRGLILKDGMAYTDFNLDTISQYSEEQDIDDVNVTTEN